MPTGFKATGQNSRSRLDNRAEAIKTIEEKLANNEEAKYLAYVNELRKRAEQNGRIRTYDFKQGLVTDHRSGKTSDLGRFLDGKVDLFKFSINDK